MSNTEIPYNDINQALSKEFGPGVVKLIPGGLSVYTLRFEDTPTNGEQKRATDIVDRFIPTEWLYDEATDY